MKSQYAIAISLVIGGALGAAAVQTLYAQAKPPVYMVAINEVTDQEGYSKQYLPTAQKTIKDHGAVYIAAGPGTQIDGSLEYENIRKVGEGFAKYNIVAVEGVNR